MTDKAMKIEAGKRLTLVRLALGYKTMSAFCEEFAVGTDALSSYENGIRAVPWKLLRALHDRKNVPSDWILHDDEASMPNALLAKTREIKSVPGWDTPVRGPKSKRRTAY